VHNFRKRKGRIAEQTKKVRGHPERVTGRERIAVKTKYYPGQATNNLEKIKRFIIFSNQIANSIIILTVKQSFIGIITKID